MMPDLDVLATLPDASVLALTIFGEARGEPVEGQIGVGCVVRNRATLGTYGGHALKGVCLKPKQFSCWNDSDPNRPTLLDAARTMIRGLDPGPSLRQCLWIAQGIDSYATRDRVNGATHYLRRDEFTAAPPSWAKPAYQVASIGAHVFLRLPS